MYAARVFDTVMQSECGGILAVITAFLPDFRQNIRVRRVWRELSTPPSE